LSDGNTAASYTVPPLSFDRKDMKSGLWCVSGNSWHENDNPHERLHREATHSEERVRQLVHSHS